MEEYGRNIYFFGEIYGKTRIGNSSANEINIKIHFSTL